MGASQVVPVVKTSPANAGDVRVLGLIPGLRRPPWGRKWQPTPVFLPGKSYRGAWWATVRETTESDTAEAT